MPISSLDAENLTEVSGRARECAFLKHLGDSGAGGKGPPLEKRGLVLGQAPSQGPQHPKACSGHSAGVTRKK